MGEQAAMDHFKHFKCIECGGGAVVIQGRVRVAHNYTVCTRGWNVKSKFPSLRKVRAYG